MDPNQGAAVKFRVGLKRELPDWIEQGLLAPEAAEQLAQRYRLADLGRDSPHLLAIVIYTLGTLLIGGGVITFVAANWEAIPVAAKVAMLFSALLGFHGIGFWLMRVRARPRLGAALIFCGCLVFGANIGLMAQIFHVRSQWYGGFGPWALGVLAMAWALRDLPSAALALGTSLVWFSGYAGDHEQTAFIYPIAMTAAVLPLAWLRQSRPLHHLTLVALIIALAILAGRTGHSPPAIFLGLTIGSALAWSVGEWHRSAGRRWGQGAIPLGIALLAVIAWLVGFHDLVRSMLREWHDDDSIRGAFWLAPLGVALLASAGALVLAWRRQPPRGMSLRYVLAVLAAAGILAGGTLFAALARSSSPPDEYIVPIVLAAHLAALLLAAVALGSGFTAERRSHFWLGTLFLFVLVISRFLEYETTLIVKSSAFMICGVLVLYGGLNYERYLRRKEKSHE